MRQSVRGLILTTLVFAAMTCASRSGRAQAPSETATRASGKDTADIFRRDNLVAWCIVPFDRAKRGPAERVEMLRRLGFRRYAYDWRDEHLPTFDAEVTELQRQGIELTAVWFPALDQNGRLLLEVLRRRKVQTQLWVTGGGDDPKSPEEHKARIIAEADRLRPIAEAAAAQGCRVALYNHGGWFGEPENQLAILDALKRPNVGIVYNLHHGHAHLDRFAEILPKLRPHLLALNLNGMVRDGDRQGRKILPLGAGDLDLELLRTIRASGYAGPIGILGHTDDDAEDRLRDNLDGLAWLLPQLDGREPGPRPRYRTPVPAAPAAARPAGNDSLHSGEFGQALDAQSARAIVPGRPEYRQPPLTIECRAKLVRHDSYNILVAHEPKSSGTHWELFTMAGTGRLTAYLPGMTPDHVRSEAVVTDEKWHHLAMIYERERVRLLVDGKPVADSPVTSRNAATQSGNLGIGSLPTHEIGCAGLIDEVRISSGVRDFTPQTAVAPFSTDERTLGLWQFDAVRDGTVADSGSLKNAARVISARQSPSQAAPEPPPGLNHTLSDPRLRARVIDRAESEVLMAVRGDPEGRLFVGGREGVFVYEPAPAGGFLPKRELYRFPADSIIIGLEWSGDDLFVLTSSALYVIPRGRTAREGVRPQRLLWGLPLDLHVSFHCLAWGPEGDLYLTHGDPLLQYGDWSRPDHWGHWTLHLEPGDRQIPYTGAGSVLRLRMGRSRAAGAAGARAAGSSDWRVDGVDVVAGGLRGPVGLAFDSDWNLFTNDNDHESLADRYAPARLLHVTPHVDFGWPRGWMASKSPERSDLIEPLSADLGRGVPCDLVWYDDPALPDGWRRLLMARWDRHAVTAYPLNSRGASFTATESTLVTGRNNARPVGVGAGHDGRLFVTSLYLPGNVASPYCFSDLIAIEQNESGRAPAPAAYDPVTVSDETLWNELRNASWLRRGWAHQEILRRGGPVLAEAPERLARLMSKSRGTSAPTPHDDESIAAKHLIWLAAATGSPRSVDLLQQLAQQGPAGWRWQALRALGNIARSSMDGKDAVLGKGIPARAGAKPFGPLFAEALHDDDPRVRLTALAFFLDTGARLALTDIARAGATDDTYLRQTAARLLARRASAAELQPLLESPEPASRLMGVLAAGLRLTVPPPHERPPETLPLALPPEGAFFKLKLPFVDAAEPVDLRSAGRAGSYTTAQWWSFLGESNGRTEDQKRLFELIVGRLADPDRRVALQAAYFLELLRDPRSEPLVVRTRQEILLRDLVAAPRAAVERLWLIGPFPEGESPESTAPLPDEGTANLTARFGGLEWSEADAQEGALPLPPTRAASSSYGCFRVESPARQPAALRGTLPGVAAAWHNGKRITASLLSDSSANIWLLDLEPGGNDLRIRFRHGDSPRSVRLELQSAKEIAVVLPERLDADLLAERLRAAAQADGTSVPREFVDVDWTERIGAGNREQGRRLFGTLGCVKCHAISADQKGGGGPSLADARRRFTILHLVESVLLPSKQTAEAFRATTIVTTGGKVFTGLVVTDDADRIELLLPDANRQSIRKSDIDEQRKTETSPMPAGLVKTVAELQDLLAYILSDNPMPP